MEAWIWALIGGGVVVIIGVVLWVIGMWLYKARRRISPPVITNGGGATNVGPIAATLQMDVTDYGRENPNVSIYWGLYDGGINCTVDPDSHTAWHNRVDLGQRGLGNHRHRVEGLLPGTPYWYRGYAKNSAGGNWASTSASFTTPAQRPDRQRGPGEDPVQAHLEAALAALQRDGGEELELPEPEVEVSQAWARMLERSADYVGRRRQASNVRRGHLRTAALVLREVQRGVARETLDMERETEMAHSINELAQTLGLVELEIVSEADQQAALNALRRANDQAEGMI